MGLDRALVRRTCSLLQAVARRRAGTAMRRGRRRPPWVDAALAVAMVALVACSDGVTSRKRVRSATEAWWGKSEASLASTNDRLGPVGHAQLGKDG